MFKIKWTDAIWDKLRARCVVFIYDPFLLGAVSMILAAQRAYIYFGC